MKREAEGISWRSLRKEWRDSYEAKRPILLFLLKFTGLMILFYAVEAWAAGMALYLGYMQSITWLSHELLNLLGQSTQASHETIRSGPYTMNVKPGCDALEPAFIFIAAVLSYPASAFHRVIGILAGLLVILPLNLVRLVTLFLAGVYLPASFPTLHLTLWPVIFIVIALLLFKRWIQWTRTCHAAA